jgi:hypothetical protein
MGGILIVESDNPAVMLDASAPFSDLLEIEFVPLIDITDALHRGGRDHIAQRAAGFAMRPTRPTERDRDPHVCAPLTSVTRVPTGSLSAANCLLNPGERRRARAYRYRRDRGRSAGTREAHRLDRSGPVA